MQNIQQDLQALFRSFYLIVSILYFIHKFKRLKTTLFTTVALQQNISQLSLFELHTTTLYNSFHIKSLRVKTPGIR